MFRKKDSDLATAGDNVAEKAPPSSTSTTTADMNRRQSDGTAPANGGAGAATTSAPGTPATAAKAEAPAAVTDAQGKRLIVGKGISLSGEITACDRLVVEGSVQVTLNETRAIEITESGRFTDGKAEVEEAEISGVYEGELTVSKRMFIRSTGRVKGTVRYGELEIERGGHLQGSVSMIEDKKS